MSEIAVVLLTFSGAIFSWLIMGIGFAALFRKDGKRAIYAFIPGVQEYVTGVIAEREEDARTYFILGICRRLAFVMTRLFDEGSKMRSLWEIIEYAFVLAMVLFSIRIFMALCNVFGQKRRWTILWVLFPAMISMIWGFSKKYVPVHANDMDVDLEKAASISNASVEADRKSVV